MIQAGDPVGPTPGTGGPGYTIPDELPADPATAYPPGTVAMANSGPESGGSQFFLVIGDQNGALSGAGSYSVFGKVIEGQDVSEAINALGGPDELPTEPVTITSVTITEELGVRSHGSAAAMRLDALARLGPRSTVLLPHLGSVSLAAIVRFDQRVHGPNGPFAPTLVGQRLRAARSGRRPRRRRRRPPRRRRRLRHAPSGARIRAVRSSTPAIGQALAGRCGGCAWPCPRSRCRGGG